MLERFLKPSLADEIIGDITEAYHWRKQEDGSLKANFFLGMEVLTSLRPAHLKAFQKLELNTMIITNYLKIALRTLLRKRSTAFINIAGLSTGVAAFIFIFLYTHQILTWDYHHEKIDRIFLAYKERITPDGIQPTYDTWVPMKDRLVADYQRVEAASRYYATSANVKKGSRYIEEEISYTDSELFSIFSFSFLRGDKNNPFSTKNSIILNEELSIKYFGYGDPIGNFIEVFLPDEDTTMLFEVSAVIANSPENASLQPDMLILIESIPGYREIENNWNSSFLETYLLLREPNDRIQLEAAFPDLIESLWDEETRKNTNFKLLPLADVYDTFFGNKDHARMLLLIGIGILLIAAINFMNLSTAQSTQRAKEIGLRKVLGAYGSQLRVQFLVESMLMSFIATSIGLCIVFLGLPYFNQYFELNLSLQTYSTMEIVMGCLSLILILGALSGSYPAIYLSSVRIIDVLRQKFSFGNSTFFRNTLVIFQFSIALFLIASTLIINKQIKYMSSQDMGFSSEGVLFISASVRDFTDRETGQSRINAFREQLKNKAYVKEISSSRSVPTAWTGSFTFVTPEDWAGDRLRMRYTYVDANFFNTYDIPIKYGSNFLPDVEGNQRNAVILNEAAMKAFQFEPEDQMVLKMGDFRVNVVGIVEDFHFETLQNEVAPTMIFHRTADNLVAHDIISIKIDMSDLSTKLDEIEAMWNELGAIQEFTYHFMDDRLAEMYQEEERYLGMVGLFSSVSIIIACLGLYGLTLFIIEKRKKEISIRKVLGAEIKTLLQLIFKDFVKWVVLAFAISIPFVYYFLSDWLESYHYHIGISWLTFVTALLIAGVLVTITVGHQSLKAASTNPVDHLKDE
ncbi:MAG: ABC transporter permease [Ekhidna sp.]